VRLLETISRFFGRVEVVLAGADETLRSGEMAIAFWYIHVATIAAGKGLGVPHNLVPINNGGIDAVAFCFAFLYIASRGPGIWSLDGLMKRPR